MVSGEVEPLVKGVLEIQERNHQAQRQARAPCGRNTGTDQLRDAAKQIRLIDNLARTNLLGKEVRDARFQFLPRHARGQHSQRVTKINHLIQAAAEEIGRVAHQTHLHKTPRKRCVPGVKLEEIIAPDDQ
jgi:hypothetical protein